MKTKLINSILKNNEQRGLVAVRLVLESLSDDDLTKLLIEFDLVSAMANNIATKHEKQCNIGTVSCQHCEIKEPSKDCDIYHHQPNGCEKCDWK